MSIPLHIPLEWVFREAKNKNKHRAEFLLTHGIRRELSCPKVFKHFPARSRVAFALSINKHFISQLEKSNSVRPLNVCHARLIGHIPTKLAF